MAKATTSKTESFTMRVPVDLITRWRTAAKARNETLAAYIIREMTPPVVALDLPKLTDFPARQVQQRGADKPKGKRS